jgi:metal-sulfur cluster biosynthetic enzyme
MSMGAGDAPSPDALRAALRAIIDPASGQDIVAAGLIEGIEIRGGLVQLALLTDRAHAARMEPVRKEAEALLARQPGVVNAAVVLTAHNVAPAAAPRAAAPVAAQPGGHAGHGHAGHGHAQPGGQAQRRHCCCPTSRRSLPWPPARAASASPPWR